MPQKKSTDNKISTARINWAERLQKVNIYLATIFLLLWIFVGLFASLVVIQSLRQGFLKGVFSSPQQTPIAQSQQQTTADLPGVGKVNIACTEQALSQDSLQKVLTSGSTSALTADEKTKLEPCIIAAASATPSAPPAQ